MECDTVPTYHTIRNLTFFKERQKTDDTFFFFYFFNSAPILSFSFSTQSITTISFLTDGSSDFHNSLSLDREAKETRDQGHSVREGEVRERGNGKEREREQEQGQVGMLRAKIKKVPSYPPLPKLLAPEFIPFPPMHVGS